MINLDDDFFVHTYYLTEAEILERFGTEAHLQAQRAATSWAEQQEKLCLMELDKGFMNMIFFDRDCYHISETGEVKAIL